MECHLWFQQLRKELREQRVPMWYANRIVNELWFHYMEMKEHDEMNGFSKQDNGGIERLGSPQTLAIQAAQLSRVNWAGRHPWLAFIVAPPAITFGLTIVSVLVTVFALKPIVEGKTLASDPWLVPLMAVLGILQVVIPSIIACFLVCRQVHRAVRSHWWAVVGCGLVAILCSVLNIYWEPPVNIPGIGRVTTGVAIWPLPMISLKPLVPVLIGVTFAIKHSWPSNPQTLNSNEVAVPVAA